MEPKSDKVILVTYQRYPATTLYEATLELFTIIGPDQLKCESLFSMLCRVEMSSIIRELNSELQIYPDAQVWMKPTTSMQYTSSPLPPRVFVLTEQQRNEIRDDLPKALLSFAPREITVCKEEKKNANP